LKIHHCVWAFIEKLSEIEVEHILKFSANRAVINLVLIIQVITANDASSYNESHETYEYDLQVLRSGRSHCETWHDMTCETWLNCKSLSWPSVAISKAFQRHNKSFDGPTDRRDWLTVTPSLRNAWTRLKTIVILITIVIMPFIINIKQCIAISKNYSNSHNHCHNAIYN